MKIKKFPFRFRLFTENLLVFLEADPPEPALGSEPPGPEKVIPLRTVEQQEREVDRLIAEKKSAEIKVDDEMLLEIVKVTNDPDILAYAAGSNNADVRDEVAQNPATSGETLRKLANDGDDYVLGSLAKNPKTPPDVLRKLANNNRRLEEPWIHDGLVNNPSTPLDVWEKLANDSDSYVRTIVAKSQYAPVSVLVKLSADKDEFVRCTVAENPHTPLKILSDLLWFEETMDSVLENPKLAEVTDGDWRKGFARYPGEKFERTRAAVASNPTTPESVLRMLADDESFMVLFGVAQNPNTPPEILIKLITKYPNEEGLVAFCARNKNMPVSELRDLRKHKSEMVRRYVAGNPNAPDDVLRAMAYDSDSRVREIVAEHSGTPVIILAMLSKDKYWLVRNCVAENPHTPYSYLLELADDPDKGVRDTARKRLRKIR